MRKILMILACCLVICGCGGKSEEQIVTQEIEDQETENPELTGITDKLVEEKEEQPEDEINEQPEEIQLSEADIEKIEKIVSDAIEKEMENYDEQPKIDEEYLNSLISKKIQETVNGKFLEIDNRINETQQMINEKEENVTQNITQEIHYDGEQEPKKIKDGTAVDCTTSIPFTFQDGDTTYNIESVEAKMYNHENEPYREIQYPYEIHVSLSGSFTVGDSGIVNQEKFFHLKLTPHESELFMGVPNIDEDSNTFTINFNPTLKIVPKSFEIVMKEI